MTEKSILLDMYGHKMVPKLRRPNKSCTQPVMRQRTMAYVASSSIGEVAKVAVMRDMMAVGPSVMSLAVPRKQYTKHPMKAEYKPYCKEKKNENCT